MNEEIHKPEQLPPAGQFSPERYFVAVAQPNRREDEVTLMDYWCVLIRYKWMIVSIVLVCTGVAATYAFVVAPVYQASVLLAPVKNDGDRGTLGNLAAQYGGLASMVGLNIGGGGSSTDEAIATLKSRVFTDQFIKDHNLLPILFPEKWDSETKKWRVRNSKDVPTMGDAYRIFNRKIRHVTDDKNTGLVTLSIDWKNREQAAAWANELVKRINQRMRSRAIDEAKKSISYLEHELTNTSVVDLQRGINTLIEDQIKKIMLANVREQYSFRVIDPAVVPDSDRYISPRRALIIAAAAFSSLLLGAVLALFRHAARRRET